MEGENATFFCVLRMSETGIRTRYPAGKRRTWVYPTGPEKILHIFSTHLRQKYESIAVDEERITAMLGADHWTTRQTYVELLDRLINMEGIRHVLQVARRNKTPGSDCVGREFYKANWSTIENALCAVLNQMYMEERITTQQKYGITVCLLKHGGAQRPTEFRPFTLLNVDYKLLVH